MFNVAFLFLISRKTPTTDFTDCVYIVRTIVLPQNMQSIALEMNIWKSDVSLTILLNYLTSNKITFTNSDTYYQLSNLTIYGGANNINLNVWDVFNMLLIASTDY